MAKRAVSKSMAGLRNRLLEFRDDRVKVKELDAGVKKRQPELIQSMQEAGIDNETGLIVDSDDPNKGVAYVQQNEASEVWDEEKILDWLSAPSRRSLRLKSSSRVWDPNKWEALVASKEVPAKVARRMKKTLDPPAPFIRFGKRKDDSL